LRLDVAVFIFYVLDLLVRLFGPEGW